VVPFPETVPYFCVSVQGFTPFGQLDRIFFARQSEFPSEMLIHLPGLRNVDNPGVWVFPKLLVCLDCGFARFTVQRAALALFADGLDNGEQVASSPHFDNVA
jgi:hypothetical protein